MRPPNASMHFPKISHCGSIARIKEAAGEAGLAIPGRSDSAVRRIHEQIRIVLCEAGHRMHIAAPLRF